MDEMYMYKFTLVKGSSEKIPSNDLRAEITAAVKHVKLLLPDSAVQYDGRRTAFQWNDLKQQITADVHVSVASEYMNDFLTYVLADLDGKWEPLVAPTAAETVPTEVPEVVLPVLTTTSEEVIAPMVIERGQHFNHIFDRDDQIEIMLSAVRAFHVSGHASRFHSILFGPPGCGKTEVLRSVHAMLGNQHSMLLDGPSTTKAGAEQMFLGVDRIKPVVLIEEIEKMSPIHMTWLLQLLDKRGEIRKTTARHGNVQRDVRILCIATVNDLEKFKSRMGGALSSRFAHEIYFPKPDEDVLRKILAREIKEVPGGADEWIEPTIRYCLDGEKSADPRRLISVCLSGREGLMDGTYLRALSLNRRLRELDFPVNAWLG